MADRYLSNPLGAFRTVPDFRLGVDDAGAALDYYAEVVDGIASAACAVGKVLTRVVPSSATVGIRYAPVAAGGSGTFLGSFAIAGICVKGATAAGGAIQFVRYGFCLAEIGAGTPVSGDMGVLSATAGQVDIVAAATGTTAAIFVGNVLGQFVGTKTGTLCPFWFDKV